MTSPRDHRDITLDVTITSDTRGVNAAAKGLDDVDKSADRAGASLRDMAGDAKLLSAEIDKANGRIAELDSQLLAVGDDRVIRSQLRRETSWLKQLEQIAKRMEAGGGGSSIGVTLGSAIGTRAGAGVFSGITDSIRAIPGTARGVLIGSAIGIGIVMAPAIGAAISGAIVGGVGVGGVVGGIVAASGDPRVKHAWQGFVGQALTADTFGKAAFVEPTIAGIRELQAAINETDIKGLMGGAAGFVQPLAAGVGDFVRNIVPGLTEAMENAGPVIDEIAQGIGDMGTALGDMARDMSEGEGAAEGMRYTFMLLNGTIHVIGDSMHWLGERFVEVTNLGMKVTGGMEDILHWGQLISPAFGLGARAFRNMNDDLERLKGGPPIIHAIAVGAEHVSGAIEDGIPAWQRYHNVLDAVNQSTEDFLGLSMSVPEAADKFEQAVDDLAESMAENGRTIDAGTEKGRQNREAWRDAFTAAREHRQAIIDLTGNTELANQKYAAEIALLEGIATKSGITKAALEGMVGQYNIDIVVRAHTVLDKTLKALFSGGIGGAASAIAALAGAKGYDDGGWVPGPKGAPQVAVVHGGEYVVSNAMQAGTQPMGVGGTQTVRFEVGGTPSGALERMFMQWMIEQLRLANTARGGLFT